MARTRPRSARNRGLAARDSSDVHAVEDRAHGLAVDRNGYPYARVRRHADDQLEERRRAAAVPAGGHPPVAVDDADELLLVLQPEGEQAPSGGRAVQIHLQVGDGSRRRRRHGQQPPTSCGLAGSRATQRRPRGSAARPLRGRGTLTVRRPHRDEARVDLRSHRDHRSAWHGIDHARRRGRRHLDRQSLGGEPAQHLVDGPGVGVARVVPRPDEAHHLLVVVHEHSAGVAVVGEEHRAALRVGMGVGCHDDLLGRAVLRLRFQGADGAARQPRAGPVLAHGIRARGRLGVRDVVGARNDADLGDLREPLRAGAQLHEGLVADVVLSPSAGVGPDDVVAALGEARPAGGLADARGADHGCGQVGHAYRVLHRQSVDLRVVRRVPDEAAHRARVLAALGRDAGAAEERTLAVVDDIPRRDRPRRRVDGDAPPADDHVGGDALELGRDALGLGHLVRRPLLRHEHLDDEPPSGSPAHLLAAKPHSGHARNGQQSLGRAPLHCAQFLPGGSGQRRHPLIPLPNARRPAGT